MDQKKTKKNIFNKLLLWLGRTGHMSIISGRMDCIIHSTGWGSEGIDNNLELFELCQLGPIDTLQFM